MSVNEHPEMGTVVGGKYRLDKPIGVGGMGAVYFATQTDLGRKVAIKLLHPLFQHDSGVTERFHREAKLAASIGHDNICEVTDFGTTDDGSPFLVMPVLKGSAFSDVLKLGPISVERVCDIMTQVLHALDAAHVAGVVHRDLKPDNIFISKVGDRDDFVKLLDFGISKVMESSAMKELTRTGTVMGTPVYMAPEQARGEKKVDHRLDIYAAGVILYESLTGQRPHDGDSYNEIVFKIITETYPPPRQINPSIPVRLEKVVLKAMAKEPSNRFASAKEMAEALKIALEHPGDNAMATASGVGAVEMPRVVPPERNAPSKKRLVPLLAVLMLLIVVGVIAAVLLKGRDRTVTYGSLAKSPTVESTSEKGRALFEQGRMRDEGAQEHQSSLVIPLSEDAPENVENAEVTAPEKTDRGTRARRKSSKTGASKKNNASVQALSPSPSAPSSEPKDAQATSGTSSQAPASPLSASPSAKASEPESEGVSLPPPASAASEKSPSVHYTHMNQLKAALNRGEITRYQYSVFQSQIREKRAADMENAKKDFLAGKLTRAQYKRRVSAIKQKYETGMGGGSVAAPPSAGEPAPEAFDNMRALKIALRQGRITKAQYAAHQSEIRRKRAAEYERIKRDYKADKISRDEYKRRLTQTRRRFEGD